MSLLYITADALDGWGGGSTVVRNESAALRSMGPCDVWDRKELSEARGIDPWLWDDYAAEEYVRRWYSGCWYSGFRPELCHIYAGTFTKTVSCLKHRDCKVTYTAAAHDLDISRREHEKLGLLYQYEHITNPDLWKRYLQGYLDADLVICPSEHSRTVMQKFGCKNVVVIPHGCEIPPESAVRPLPTTFRVGYLGSYGPDKGVAYLLEAWKKLNYHDATLVLGGRDSASPWVRYLIDRFGGGNIEIKGWVHDVGDFYNDISLYVQPSATEGFGIEVAESLGYARPVVCSDGAGASDIVTSDCGVVVRATRVDELTEVIGMYKKHPDVMVTHGKSGQLVVRDLTWEKIKLRYVKTWESPLSQKTETVMVGT